MFPSHVRRRLLVSNINPRGDGYHLLLATAPIVQRNLGFWFHWLARHHHVYHLGRTAHSVHQLFNATEGALWGRPAGGVVGPAEWVDTFFLTAFTTPDFYWPYLGDVFRKWAISHRAGPLVQADAYYATFVAVRCMDSPWPRSWPAWRHRARRYNKTAPFTTWGNAWYVMPCRTWPTTVPSRVHINGHQVPALILDDQYDGSVAFSADLAVRQRFPAASLVEVRGGLAHTDSVANPCEHRIVTRYLATGSLPPRQPGWHADATCAGDPRPTP